MRRWPFLFALLVPVFVAVFSTPVEAATQVGDVYLNTGEILENVEFDVKPRLRAITVYGPKGQRSFSFLDLAGIEVDGEDVTAELTGRRSTIEQRFRSGSTQTTERDGEAETGATDTETPGAAPPTEAPRTETRPVEPTPLPADAGWISKDDPTYRRLNAPTHRATLRVAALFSLPFGDYLEPIEGGVGFDATAFVPINRRAGVRVSAAKTGLQWDDRYALLTAASGAPIGPQYIDFDSWRYSVAAQFYQHVGSNSDRLSMFYAYSGAGLWRGTLNIDPTAVPEEDYSEKETESKFLLVNGVGMTAMVSRHFGLDFSLEWDLIFAGSNESTYSTNDIQYASEVAFQAGVLVMFH